HGCKRPEVRRKSFSLLWSSVLHSRFVDRYRRLRHQVHGVAGWQVRQLLQAHLHDDLGNGSLDSAFKLFYGLLVQMRHQSDFFVLSVFNCSESIDTNFSAATLISSLPFTLPAGSKRMNWIAVIATRRCNASGHAYCQFLDPNGVGWSSRSRASMSACRSMISISFFPTSSPVFSASRRTSSGTL